MKRRELLYLMGAAAASAADQQRRPLTPEERKKIEAAVPGSPAIEPAKPRRLLVMTTAMRDGRPINGHGSISAAKYALQLTGKRTGAFAATFDDDVNALASENLKQFDGICFANTQGVITDDPALRLSLLDFVAGGKGFAGFHAAAATFVQHPVYDQFPAFGEFIGGYENGGHPWGPDESITLRVEDPGNPINAPFGGKGFEVMDEVFQFMDGHFSRTKLHVLLSIDTSTTDVGPNRRIYPDRRKDLDFPITWIKRYGLGRVFYTTLGHSPHIWWDERLLAHFVAGIQFALGDLEAYAAPDIKPPGGSKT